MSEPIKRTLSIAAPPPRVLEVITDFAEYPNWQKEVASGEVLDRDDTGRPVRARLVTVAMGLKAEYEIALTYDDDGVRWTLVAGDTMTQNDSSYVLRSTDEGGTEVDLTMAIGLKWNLPAFMLKQLITKGVNDNLKAVKRVAEG